LFVDKYDRKASKAIRTLQITG